jgi:hypothetical protein
MTLTLAALLSATSLSAQGIPALGASKAAATRAVNATNAHTHEETGQAITQKPVNAVGSPAAAQPATKSAAAAAQPAAAAKSVTRDTTKKQAEAAPATSSLSREVFRYEGNGRRDPFLSLLSTGELRPAFNDLKLVAVAYDPTGRKSVAVMRDISSKDQYRVKVGQTLGRMRVAQIHPKSVTFTIDEFGYSRQDVLTLGDSTNMRNP